MSAIRFLTLALATVGFVSVLPYRLVPFRKWKGGGLLGSLAGWGLFWLLPADGPALWAAVLAMALFSIPVSHYAERWLGEPDDPRIVIDEVAGVWLAAAGLPRALPEMLAALFLFRLFDVWKGPWGRWTARAPGGLGVVADDLAAGLLANGLARLLIAILPSTFSR